MATDRSARSPKVKHGGAAPRRKVAPTSTGDRPIAAGPAAALEEARRSGLLDGDKTKHVSFRAPRALVEAAKRESGVASPTELGILALAMLAQRDPFVELMKRTRGRLGAAHTLDY